MTGDGKASAMEPAAAGGSHQMYQDSFAQAGLNGDTPSAGVALEQPAPPSRLAGVFSAVISVALLGAVFWQLRSLNFGAVVAMIPRAPMFWAIFAVYYLMPPLTEWVIYRRLWGLPASGVLALLRKRVLNELLLSYLGEVQFYVWARARLKMVTAPFGAIKDVSILSALTGNIATLTMLYFAWPFVREGMMGKDTSYVFSALAVVLVPSFVILLFRSRLFTLPRRELAIITGLHFWRIISYVALTALMWHYVLPDVDIELWLVLATLQMMISRLPLMPNKDLVFAGLSVFLLGHEPLVGSLVTMVAGVTLMTNVGFGLVFGCADIIGARVER